MHCTDKLLRVHKCQEREEGRLLLMWASRLPGKTKWGWGISRVHDPKWDDDPQAGSPALASSCFIATSLVTHPSSLSLSRSSMASVSSASSADVPVSPGLDAQPRVANDGESTPQEPASKGPKSIVWKKWPVALRALIGLLPMYQAFLKSDESREKRAWQQKTTSELIEHKFPQAMVETFGTVKLEKVRDDPLFHLIITC